MKTVIYFHPKLFLLPFKENGFWKYLYILESVSHVTWENIYEEDQNQNVKYHSLFWYPVDIWELEMIREKKFLGTSKKRRNTHMQYFYKLVVN